MSVKTHEQHRLGDRIPKASIIKGKKHPHHMDINIPRSSTRQIKGGLKIFRD